jgi:ketosteroid isomerase-like protein
MAGAGVTVTNPDAPVHVAGKRSREAAMARDKDTWLALFADDAVIEDPIGPSHFDPEGKGHRGKEAIAKFFDAAIAPSELTFNFVDTFQCGNEEANVGNIVIVASGYRVVAEGVFTYRVNDDGKIAALRAYWELDRAAASATPV